MSPYVWELAVIAIFILLSCVTLVRNKTLLINEYVHDDAIDILANTETWLKRGGDSAFITELTSSWNILMKQLASPCFKHMELLRVRLMGKLHYKIMPSRCLRCVPSTCVNQELGHIHWLHDRIRNFFQWNYPLCCASSSCRCSLIEVGGTNAKFLELFFCVEAAGLVPTVNTASGPK